LFVFSVEIPLSRPQYTDHKPEKKQGECSLSGKKELAAGEKAQQLKGKGNTKKKNKKQKAQNKTGSGNWRALNPKCRKKRIIKCLPHLDTPRKKTPKKKDEIRSRRTRASAIIVGRIIAVILNAIKFNARR